jgi:uncharacterized protein YraI
MLRSSLYRAISVAALMLAGCAIMQPDMTTAKFQTVAEVALRSGQDDESSVVAMLPKGTPVAPVGWVGAECVCWKVDTPQGTGWLYQRYIDLRAPIDEP